MEQAIVWDHKKMFLKYFLKILLFVMCASQSRYISLNQTASKVLAYFTQTAGLNHGKEY